MTTPAPAATTARQAIITITGVNKWYNEFHVLKDINLEVGRGEKLVIWAPRAPASRP